MRKIGKDGKVWRLSKDSWEILVPFDSDPNIAIARMNTALKALAPQPTANTAANVSAQPCQFNEQRLVISLRRIVKEAVDEALVPFSNG